MRPVCRGHLVVARLRPTDAHRRSRAPIHRAWFWIGLLAAGPVPAAEIFTDATERASLEGMQVTATRNARPVHEVAPAVTLVGQTDIERDSPQVLAEALRGEVGTFFQQTTPGQGTVIIRGLKGSQILHLVDGMRLNNAFFRSAPNQYLALVDPYATAQMEVVRGAAATLYGSDAMGGVVQVLTGEPEFGGERWNTQGRVYSGATQRGQRQGVPRRGRVRSFGRRFEGWRHLARLRQ